jgi:hypothetical protein
VVLQIAVIAHPAKAQPKTPAAVLSHNLVQHIDHRRIPFGSVRWLTVISRPKKAYTATGLGDGKFFFANQESTASRLMAGVRAFFMFCVRWSCRWKKVAVSEYRR